MKKTYLILLSLSCILNSVERGFAASETNTGEFFAQKKWAEAAIGLKATVERDPQNARAVLDLASALTYLKRREEALGVLARAAQKTKVAAQGERFKSRIQVISRLFISHDTFQIFQDGLNLMLVKKYKLARDFFSRALIQEPANVDVLLRLGQCYVLEKDFDSAAESLRFAKRLNANDPQIGLWLGKALYERGELTAALEELSTAYLAMRDSELATVWFAQVLQEVGQGSSAMKLLDIHLKKYSWHIPVLMTKALLQMRSEPVSVNTLLQAKKNIQLALDRLDQYAEKNTDELRDEVNFLEQDAEELKKELISRMKAIESRLIKFSKKSELPSYL